MLHEDRELLTELKRACNQAGQFTLEYMSGGLTIEAEEAYALRLIDIAERLLAHATTAKVSTTTANRRRSLSTLNSSGWRTTYADSRPGAGPMTGRDDPCGGRYLLLP